MSEAGLTDPSVGDGANADVLVVDDTPANLLALQAALDGLPYRLVTARSGEEALRKVLARDFALILLDVQMPTMSGLESARLIRARRRSQHTPIIFITGHGRDHESVREAYRLGAVDFLSKPIEPDILRAKAQVLVELKRRTDEVARQARELRRHERLERDRALAEQRAVLEADAMRERLEEQRVHAAELERLNRRLEENDKRKNEFIAILGHELRNPLAPLVSGLELLQSRDVEVQQEAQVVMKRQVHHLSRLVDDLLDVSRVTRGKIELQCSEVEVAALVRQAVSQVQALAHERNQELVVRGTDVLGRLEGDEVRLVQVLSNLLSNAVRYSEPGGSIELHAEAAPDELTFRVRDRGKGIPAELLPRIFDLFVQGSSTQGGLGIGLTLVQQLVRLHGGNVSVSSGGDGSGSEFTVRLPRELPAPRRQACQDGDAGSSNLALARRPSSDGGSPPIWRPLQIVLIEDNEDARFLMAEMLGMWGHEVREAGAGGEGLALLDARAADLVFVDIGLPDMEGYEVARRVRAQSSTRHPRLIALSGFGQDRDRQCSQEAGFDHHLVKPASIESLQALLEKIRPSVAQGARASESPSAREERGAK